MSLHQQHQHHFKKYSSEDIATLTIARNIGSCKGWHVTSEFLCFGTMESEGCVYVYQVDKLDNLQEAVHSMVKSPFNKTFPVSVYYLSKLDLIFVGYDNGCIVIFDGKSREKKQIIRGCHHIKKILVISNKEKHLLVAGCDQGDKSHLLFWKITKNSNHVDYSSTDLKQFEFNSHISDLHVTDIFLESIKKETKILICPLLDDSFKLLYNIFEKDIVEMHFNKDHLNLNGGISSMSFDQDKEGVNDLCLCAMLNGKFQVYNLSNGTLQKTIQATKHNSIECIAFDGVLMNVCIGGSEGNVSIYNIENQEPTLIKCIENCHDGFVTSIAQCENFFTTGSQDGTIKVLDKKNGELIVNLDQKHTSCITHLEFIEEHLLISSSEDGTIRMHILNIAKIE